MRKVLFLLAVLTLAVAVPAYAANVAGTWALSQSGPQGAENFDVTITDNGGNLAVTATHSALGEMAGTGTLKGNDINFNLKASGGMAVEFVYTGKVTGKKMEGTKEINMDMAAGGGGGQGGAPGGDQGGAPAGGGQGGPPAAGGQGGAPAGGGQGGAPAGGGQGGAPAGGGQGGPPAAGGQGGAPAGGGQGGGMGDVDPAWSAVMK